MEFRLLYEGPLQGQNAKAEHKREIRRYFHPQLKRLWTQPPLNEASDLLAFPAQPGKISVVEPRGSVQFVPLVTGKLDLYAELDVLFFRPQPRGQLITDAGDIDNRLKTLLDTLRIHRAAQEDPRGDESVSDKNPFFCLLQDDSLVTKVTVEVDQLLDASDSAVVKAIVPVTVKKTRLSWNNMVF
jgi:hypothetical protein